MMLRILLIRTDRTGDLVLSIPVIRAIRFKLKEAKIGFLVSEENSELLSHTDKPDYIYPLKRDFSNYEEIFEKIKSQDFTHSITLFVDSRASWIPLRAKIPVRIGPISKLSSLVKFNRGMVQRRSLSKKNEALYNLDLLSRIGIDYREIPVEQIKPLLRISEDDISRFTSSMNALPSRFVVIHPGMGGSALNTGKETYLKIAKDIVKFSKGC